MEGALGMTLRIGATNVVEAEVSVQTTVGAEADPLHGGGAVDPLHGGGAADPLHDGGAADPLHGGGAADPLHVGDAVDPHQGGGAVDLPRGGGAAARPDESVLGHLMPTDEARHVDEWDENAFTISTEHWSVQDPSCVAACSLHVS